MCTRPDWRRRGILLATLIVPSTLLYMAYYWGGGGGGRNSMSLRFLVPTLYIYALAGVWFLKTASEGRPRAAIAAASATLALVLALGIPSTVDDLQRLREGAAPLTKITETLKRTTPAGSVVIANQQILQHLHFVGRWRLIDERALMNPAGGERRNPRRINAPANSGADQPNPQQAGKDTERIEAYKNLRGNALIDRMDDDIWAWAGKNGKVYWVGQQAAIDEFEWRLRPQENLETIETIELPQSLRPEGQRARGMGMPGQMGLGADPMGAPPMGKAFQRPNQMGMQGFPGDRGVMGGPGEFGMASSEPLILAEWTRK